MSDGHTTLYRLYDSTGALLYVGIFLRLPVHHGKSWFIPEVVGWQPAPLTPAVHFDTLVHLYNQCEAA